MNKDQQKKYDIQDLIQIMKRLRDPENGCPWDVKQDFQSIAPYTLEEAYEVADAIQRKNFEELKEELGDLLFQVIFHSEMAAEEDKFNFSDVVQVISEKMVRRHPHVFDNEKLLTDEDIKSMWERVKREEQVEKKKNQGVLNSSHLDGVPVSLPGLVRAIKLQKKAATVGFDWSDITPVFAKLEEELNELKDAIENTKQNPGNSLDDISAEYGDLLFVMANLGRHLNIDPEGALRAANQKFIYRFHYIENGLQKTGQDIEEASLNEMEALWEEAKIHEK